VIGALGDAQDKNSKRELIGLNEIIMVDAINANYLKVDRDLTFFGRETRPIHKALEYCSDPFIPGVSGSESGAIQFLQQLGIDPKIGNSWKKINDLTDEERQKLVAGTIMRRVSEKKPEDVLGTIYTLSAEKLGTPTKDVRVLLQPILIV